MKNNSSCSLLSVVLLSIAIWVSNGGSTFADQVFIESASRPGYGRLVFNWPTPVSFKAKISGNRLVVEFGRPIVANYGSAIDPISKYIGGAQASLDGRSVSFSLKKTFGLRSFDSGAAIVVDLLDDASRTTKTSQANPRAGKLAVVRTPLKSSRPAVKVRRGQHANYSRIVFDWPTKVKYKFLKSGEIATISFLSPAKINLASVGQPPLKFIKGINARSGDNGPIVTLKVPETSQVKHFLVGPKVVVDIFAPGTKKGPSKLAKKDIKGVKKKSKKPAQLVRSSAAVRTPVSIVKKVGTEVAGKPLSLVPGKSVPPIKGGNLKNIDPSATQLKGAAGEITLKFNWQESVAAAVFPRAGALWIIFDRKLESLNIEELRAAGGNAIRSIDLIPSENGTVLRLVTISGINPTLKRDGFAWIFDFKKQNLQLNRAIGVKAQPNSPIGARIFMPVQNPGNPVIVTDPEVGDKIVVVPVAALGNGVVKRYIYPQLQILPSSQGVVIRPWVDNIRVRSLSQGVEISSLGQLVISSNFKAPSARKQSSKLRALTRLLDFKRWRNVTPKAFTQDRRKLQFDITGKKGLKREDARLELAKFYMANGFGAEIMGLMRIIEKDRPAAKDDPEFRLIRGIGSYMLGRFSDSKTDIYHKSIGKYDEGVFWQAVVDGTIGDRAQASFNLRRLGLITRTYPDALKYPLSLLITEAAIDVGDVRIAKRFLGAIEAEEKLSPSLKGQLSFTKGRFLELSGDFENAVVQWEKAVESKHRPSSSRATVARAELLLKLKKFSRGEAIDELETLRFAWRGDEFEFNLLRRLGRLYVEDGNFRNGLLTLKQAATHFRAVEKAKEVTQAMSDAFKELYLNSAADSLPPVTAIALYYEFKELTPVGVKGDEMIRKLADRLVGIDLLDDGARLLEEQVNLRLKGEERARVAARLAVVHIMNNNFVKARNVLHSTNEANLPPLLVEERRHLLARALMGLKLDDAAVELLNADKSINANLLRIEIFWNSKDWANASRSLRSSLRQMNAKPDKPLTDEQGRYVLNLAISMTLSGNERATSRIRQDFGSAMNETSYGDAFRLIAGSQTGAGVDYRAISRKVKDAELFTTFMAAYKERLKSKSISEIN